MQPTHSLTQLVICTSNLFACLLLGVQDAEATDTVLPVTYPQLHNMVEKGGAWEACRPRCVIPRNCSVFIESLQGCQLGVVAARYGRYGHVLQRHLAWTHGQRRVRANCVVLTACTASCVLRCPADTIYIGRCAAPHSHLPAWLLWLPDHGSATQQLCQVGACPAQPDQQPA